MLIDPTATLAPRIRMDVGNVYRKVDEPLEFATRLLWLKIRGKTVFCDSISIVRRLPSNVAFELVTYEPQAYISANTKHTRHVFFLNYCHRTFAYV